MQEQSKVGGAKTTVPTSPSFFLTETVFSVFSLISIFILIKTFFW